MSCAQVAARPSPRLTALRTTIRARASHFACAIPFFLPLPKYPQKNGTGNSAKKAAPKKPQKNGTGNLPKKPAKIKNRNFAK